MNSRENSNLFLVFHQVDPRHFQIAILSVLLLPTAFATQYVSTRIFRLPAFDPRSPLISGLSLCLLLRTNSLILTLATATLTILSKFIFKWNRKHIFNPTNFGLVVMMLLTDQVWVSPGQWGSRAFFGFLIACLGGMVIHRSARSDETCAFLFSYTAILLGRAIWLGDPLTIPLHQLQNGAFLLFAFYMISDPKTTPNSRAGRILHAFLVATGAAYIQFGLSGGNRCSLYSIWAFSDQRNALVSGVFLILCPDN
jgi:Na+-transporting NADH:ubiquinone oxidoreductase subunit NqrB